MSEIITEPNSQTTNPSENPQKTYSGPDENKVKSIFKSVAKKYDSANDVITGGMHRSWRKRLLHHHSGAVSGDKVLDCATGTGDLAIEFKKIVGDSGEVIGCDFCQEMLDFAPEKAQRHDVKVRFEFADVTKLPYEDGYFDIATIGFGIRNVNDPELGLSEMARVTRPGGKILILETGQVDNFLMYPFYRLYTKNILPLLGGLVTGHREAYEYLQNSSKDFPSRDSFLSMMYSTGCYEQCGYEALMGGSAYIYWGRVKA